VGHLRIADRDFVESSNLQRQTMFTELDASERLPKAIACAQHVREINSEVTVEAEIVDVNHSNIERLIGDCDVVLDGTDNFSTRYLINDACVKHNVKWIYGRSGKVVRRDYDDPTARRPVLALYLSRSAAGGECAHCDTAGVIMPIISVVAAVQVTEALKLLTGHSESLHKSLMQFDVWRNEWRRIGVGERAPDVSAVVLVV